MQVGRQKPAWLVRLTEEIERSGASKRSLSQKAGLGPNFVSELTGNQWKDPAFSHVVKLCHILDVSMTYIVTGVRMSRFEEEVLSLIAEMVEDERASLIAFLRAVAKPREPS